MGAHDRPTATRRFASNLVPSDRRAGSLVAVALAILAAAAPARAQSGPYGILVNGIDHTTPRSEIAARLQLVRDAGAQWVRTDFWWYSVEWNQGAWDWRFFDAVVDEATARGLQVIPILWGTPGWAATDGVFSYGVPDMAAWERFVASTVTRYRGRVGRWEIWNEPDGAWYWAGTAGQYAELLARAYRQVKLADPAALVLLGGLAQGGGAVPDFLQRILADARYPAGAYFDVHNVHTNFRSMGAMADQIRNNISIVAGYAGIKPIVVTESSYASDPAYQSVTGYTGGEDGQARYVTDAYATMLGAGVQVAVWASLMDYSGSGEYASSGLVRTDRTPKPAFDAYRRAVAASGQGPAPVEPTAPSGPGLVAYWMLDDGSGTTALDASGNGNAGVLVNGPTWTAGIVRQALAFDGVDDHVRVEHAGALDAYPLTVAAWVRTGAKRGVQGIVNKYVANSYNGYQLFLNAGTVCAWYFRDAANAVYDGTDCTLGAAGVNDGQWHHVAFVVDATGGRLYVDGAPRASRAWTGTAGPSTTLEPLRLGYYPGLARGSHYFAGALDDVRLYNQALSADDIEALYRAGAFQPTVSVRVKKGPTRTTAAVPPGGGAAGMAAEVAVDVEVANPGAERLVDVYFGIVLPADGGDRGCPARDPVAFLADGFARVVLTCLSAPAGDHPALFRGISLPGGLLPTAVPGFWRFVWTPGMPAGPYTVFLALTDGAGAGTSGPIAMGTSTLALGP